MEEFREEAGKEMKLEQPREPVFYSNENQLIFA